MQPKNINEMAWKVSRYVIMSQPHTITPS